MTTIVPHLTETDVRRIVREEMSKAVTEAVEMSARELRRSASAVLKTVFEQARQRDGSDDK